MIFELSAQEHDMIIIEHPESDGRPARNEIADPESRLQIAAEVMQSFLEEANTVVSVDPVEVTWKLSKVDPKMERSWNRNKDRIMELMETMRQSQSPVTYVEGVYK